MTALRSGQERGPSGPRFFFGILPQRHIVPRDRRATLLRHAAASRGAPHACVDGTGHNRVVWAGGTALVAAPGRSVVAPRFGGLGRGLLHGVLLLRDALAVSR